MTSSFDIPDIPLIDFRPFLLGSPSERENVASSVDAGLCSTGFIYLQNHGIDQRKIDECFDMSIRFFALPEAEKKLIHRSLTKSQHRGYSGLGNEMVREHVCMKEGFTCGNSKDDVHSNIWPSENLLPGFRDLMEELFKDCTELVHQLLECLSIALKLPVTQSLSRHHTRSFFNFDLLHYPPISAQLIRSGALSRIPAHSDTGTLTLLFQDNTGGLEIADLNSASTERSAEFEKTGKFRHVKPLPGTVIVNVGYLLMRWSNGRWRNTIHRVMEPPSSLQGISSVNNVLTSETPNDLSPARYSIPFCVSPDPDTIVEALPGCWNEETPKRWKPLNADNYLRRKREGMYA